MANKFGGLAKLKLATTNPADAEKDQAKAMSKILLKLGKKIVEENPHL
jgi:hypothetical protein